MRETQCFRFYLDILLQEREGGEEEEVEVEDSELPPDQDLSASEKKMLLRIRNRNRLTKAERSSMRRLKRRKERQRREEEREILQARYTRHRSDIASYPLYSTYLPLWFCISILGKPRYGTYASVLNHLGIKVTKVWTLFLSRHVVCPFPVR